MVQGAVNLLGLSVLPEQSPQHSLPAHPDDLGRHSAFAGTSTLTGAGVVSSTLRLEMQSGSGPRVDLLFALHDEAVFD